MCFARERRTRRACRVQRIVFATKPSLSTGATANLVHRLATAAQITSEAGAVMTGTLDCPNARTRRVLIREADGFCVAASVRTHRPLRDQRTRRSGDDRQHVLIAMSVNTDHVIQLV